MKHSVLLEFGQNRTIRSDQEDEMTAVLEAPTTSPEVAPEAYRWRWLAYSAVLASTVMDLLDSTVVGVAGPAIQSSLGGTYASLQWMGAGYTMALAVLLL